jgi:hypothetical protein
VMTFHGEPGWTLYSNGAPEWKRAMDALKKARAALAVPPAQGTRGDAKGDDR